MSKNHQNSKEKLILEAVGIGTWEWWLPENKVHFDDIWCRQLGLDPMTVKHEFSTWQNAVHPHDLAGALEAVNRHLEGKTPEFWFTVRMKHTDGHWVFISSKGRCLERDSDGNPRHVAGTHQDVTVSVERDELSEKIQSMAKLGGWEMDVVTQRTQWTKETYRLHAIPYDTPTSKVMGIKFYSEQDQPRIAKYVEELIKNGTSFLDTFQFRDANGVEKVVRVSGEPIRAADGHIMKVHGIFQDVTEELKREKEREELRRQLLEAQQVARIGSWSFDVATGRIFWSDVMFEFFPENKEQGPPSFERHVQTVHPEDQAHFVKTIQGGLETGRNYKMRYRTRNLLGQELWLEGIGHAVKGPDGKVIQLYGTCQDITERVEAERKLQEERSKALHTAKLASLGEMSAGVAHEINNPLALIVGTASLLPRFANNPELLAEKADKIKRAGDRIAKIVNGLRKYARTNDKSSHRKQSLGDLIQESVTIIEAKAKRNGVQLQVCIDQCPEVVCDGAEIEQVIVNLVSNGIDAAKSQPEKWVKIHSDCQSGTPRLSIEDSGPGVPEELKEKVFLPFFTTKPAGEGTGLGLSIVKGILEDHHAKIRIQSGQGPTRFEILFPVEQEAKGAA